MRPHPRAVGRGVREQRGGERPAPLHLRRRRPPAPGEAPAGVARALRQREARCPQRREGVVRDLSRPGEVPQRLLQLGGLAVVEVGEQVAPERGAAGEPLADGVVERAPRARSPRVGRRAEPAGVLAEVQRHPARARPDRAGPDPHDLPASAELVHPGLRVRADAARQHVALPHLRRQREALQRQEHLAEPVDPGGARGVHALPRGQEARQRPLLGGLDLLAERGERGAPQAAQHVGVAPLALAPARPQLAADQVAGGLQIAQHRAAVDRVAVRDVPRGERPVGAGVAARQARERLLDLLEEHLRQAARRHGPEGVAVEAGVLGREPALLAADAHADGPAPLLEVAQHALRRHRLEAALLRLVGRQVAHRAQHVVHAVGVGGAGALAGALEVGLHLLERARVDQLAQLLLAEQLPQQLAVERQRRGAPLGVGRVALVHVGRDVVEQQRRGERGGALRLDLDQRQLPRVQAAQQRLEAGQVEHVAQALAVGLEHDRELAVALGHLEQRLRLRAAAATAACACRAGRAAAAAPGRRSRGSGRRTAPSSTARAPPAPRARRAARARAPRRAARRRRAGGR